MSTGRRAGKYKDNEPKGDAVDPEGSTATSSQAAWI